MCRVRPPVQQAFRRGEPVHSTRPSYQPGAVHRRAGPIPGRSPGLGQRGTARTHRRRHAATPDQPSGRQAAKGVFRTSRRPSRCTHAEPTARRRAPQRRTHAARGRGTGRAASMALASPAPHPRAAAHSHCLAAHRTARRAQPAGTAYDRSGRSADASAGALVGRAMDSRAPPSRAIPGSPCGASFLS